MKKIFAIIGSLRKESTNELLLEAFRELLLETTLFKYPSLGNLPYFNPDLEIPTVVQEFKKGINEADYLLIITPEYAHGMPGVLKNALDWLVSDEELPGKEVIVLVCSAGDGLNTLNSLREVLKTMSFQIDPDRFISVSGIRSKFVNGKLCDHHLSKKLEVIARKI